MKPFAWRWIIGGVMALAIATILFITYQRSRDRNMIRIPDETAAAEALLGEKLSGPRYFSVPVAGVHEEGGPWIDITVANRQVPRVAAERKFTPEATRKLETVIGQLAEPHPFRIVGGERIKLSRLNLSLDAIKP